MATEYPLVVAVLLVVAFGGIGYWLGFEHGYVSAEKDCDRERERDTAAATLSEDNYWRCK